MNSVDSRLLSLGVRVPDIMVPKEGTDLTKWAVVACDQYTSQPEYWQNAASYVGDSPSTLKLIYPECYLEEPQPQKRIDEINRTMDSYVDSGLFRTYEHSFFLVRRSCARRKARWGLIVALDLERYSWEKDSRSLIRATEGTILSRIPPRKAIRKDAALELPHIMVLINDRKGAVIEALAEKTDALEPVYDTPLMAGGGQLTAWAVSSEEDIRGVADALQDLYDALDPDNRLLFAMGDGNHSFATAKSCWEDIRENLSEEQRQTHPARFCLVELENIFSPGLEFEPIHRVLFNTRIADVVYELSKECSAYTMTACDDLEGVLSGLAPDPERQTIGLCDENGFCLLELEKPQSSLAAGSMQAVIDRMTSGGRVKVDYIHGTDVTSRLGQKPGNVGVFLPDVSKDTFFDSIVRDGALPRKTFSMGEAQEKRYYMEARRIR